MDKPDPASFPSGAPARSSWTTGGAIVVLFLLASLSLVVWLLYGLVTSQQG